MVLIIALKPFILCVGEVPEPCRDVELYGDDVYKVEDIINYRGPYR